MVNCENCGAPMASATPGTSVTCTHCGHTNQVPGGRASSSSGGSGGSSRDGSGAIPQIVVVTASSPSQQRSRPIVVVQRRGYRTHFSLFGFLLTMAIFYSVYYYSMRLRNNVAATVNAAEHSAEHGGNGEHEHKKK